MKIAKILICLLFSGLSLIELSSNVYAQRVRTICKNCLPAPSVSVSPGAAVASGQLLNGVSNVFAKYRGSKSSGQASCTMSGESYTCQLSGLNVGAYQVDISYSLDGSTFFTNATDFKVLSQVAETPCEINNNNAEINVSVNPNTRHATLIGSRIPSCIRSIHFTQIVDGGWNWVTNPISGEPETESWNYDPVNFPVSNGSFNQLIRRENDGGPLAPKTWRMNACFRTAQYPGGSQVGCKAIEFIVPPSNLAVCSGNVERPQPVVSWGASEANDLISSTTFAIPEGVAGIVVEVQKNGNPEPVRLYNSYLPTVNNPQLETNNGISYFSGSVINLGELSNAELQTVTAIRLVYQVSGSSCFMDNDAEIKGDWVNR